MIIEKQLTNQKKASYLSIFLLPKKNQSQFKENMDFEFVQ